MKSASWAELLKKIPPEHHERLVIATSTGVEISIQRVLCIETEYFLARGRLGGTSDTFRLFCLPYDRLLYFGFSRPVPDPDLVQIFGPILTPMEEHKDVITSETVEEPTPSEPVANEKPPDTKFALLEKLRARVASHGNDPSRPR